MQFLAGRTSSGPMDGLSRVVILTAGLFTIVALTLSIVGTATYQWFYNQDATGATYFYNFFTVCRGQVLNQSSNCLDMPRYTALGIGTQQAAGLLVVALCLLGLGMLITLSMNCLELKGVLSFLAPLLLFLAALFMVASLAEGSRVTTFNSYSANLVQTGHLLTIFSMGLVGFASGRLSSMLGQ